MLLSRLNPSFKRYLFFASEDGDAPASSAKPEPEAPEEEPSYDWGDNERGGEPEEPSERASERIQKLNAKVKEEQEKRIEAEKKLAEKAETPTDRTQVVAQFDKLAREAGYAPMTEIQRRQAEDVKKAQEREDVAKMGEEVEALKKKFPGGDGGPKFDWKEVKAHAIKEKMFNPFKAFKDLHEEAYPDAFKKPSTPPPPAVDKPAGESPTAPEGKKPDSWDETKSGIVEKAKAMMKGKK